ncbi:helix-turn-helix transcriptional regulator [Streptomyces pseudovenezuelae]|uniref:helix-turn-helix transcriptional regulator n=1 Tax=Streptomyces pseudovenezuelae TaxID=67350 RepID=UPI0036EF5F75
MATEEPTDLIGVLLALLRDGVPDRYLTPEDLVTMFSLPSVETVYQWRRKRIGPPGFRVGRYLRFNPAAVAAWEAERTALEEAA